MMSADREQGGGRRRACSIAATRLPSSYALAFYLSLLSQAYLAHQNAPLLLLESTADPGGGRTLPPEPSP